MKYVSETHTTHIGIKIIATRLYKIIWTGQSISHADQNQTKQVNNESDV